MLLLAQLIPASYNRLVQLYQTVAVNFQDNNLPLQAMVGMVVREEEVVVVDMMVLGVPSSLVLVLAWLEGLVWSAFPEYSRTWVLSPVV